MLQGVGYATAASGKWHLGEGQANSPVANGCASQRCFRSLSPLLARAGRLTVSAASFDTFTGFEVVSECAHGGGELLGGRACADAPSLLVPFCAALPAVYTEWRDPRIHPSLVARPARQQLISGPIQKRLVVADWASGTTYGPEIDIPFLEQIDEVFLNHSLAFLANASANASRVAGGGPPRPFFLYHATTGCHFDNYPGVWTGASPAAYPCTSKGKDWGKGAAGLSRADVARRRRHDKT